MGLDGQDDHRHELHELIAKPAAPDSNGVWGPYCTTHSIVEGRVPVVFLVLYATTRSCAHHCIAGYTPTVLGATPAMLDDTPIKFCCNRTELLDVRFIWTCLHYLARFSLFVHRPSHPPHVPQWWVRFGPFW